MQADRVGQTVLLPPSCPTEPMEGNPTLGWCFAHRLTSRSERSVHARRASDHVALVQRERARVISFQLEHQLDRLRRIEHERVLALVLHAQRTLVRRLRHQHAVLLEDPDLQIAQVVGANIAGVLLRYEVDSALHHF